MKKTVVCMLGLVVLVGAFLRMYNIPINPPGLYIDEVSIGLNAYDVLTTGKDQYGVVHPLIFQSFGDYKVPGYIYVVAGSMAIFGKNELAIRFPSALAGTLTILVLFFLLVEILKKSKQTEKYAYTVSLITAGVFALTPWHIHFSRGGFEAVFALLLYTLGLFLAVRFWITRRVWNIFLTALLFLGALYTYDAYRVIVPLTASVGFLLGIRDGAKRKGILLASVVLVSLAFPLFLFSLTSSGQMRFLQTSAFSENPYTTNPWRIVADAAIFIRNYFSYFSLTYLFRFGDQINRHQVNDLGILYLWQLPFIGMGVYFLVNTKNRVLQLIVSILLFIGIVPAAIAKPSPHTLRYLIGSVPYAILTGFGIWQVLLRKEKWMRFFFVALMVFAVIEVGYYLYYYSVQYPKEALIDWGGSCKAVALAVKQDSARFQHIVVDKNLGCVKEYFLFYTPTVPFSYASSSWTKPTSWTNQKVLFVRPFYGNPMPDHLLENIYLPNINHDVFAQLISL